MAPRPIRPSLARGYGVESARSAPGERLPWATVRERLETARNYWVATTRPDGRPHVKPVWGLWLDDAFWFSTHADGVTGRNLRHAPHVSVHLESGEHVTIVEGIAERRFELGPLPELYGAKYDMDPASLDPNSPGMAFFVVRPSSALSWEEAALGETIARWAFSRVSPYNEKS